MFREERKRMSPRELQKVKIINLKLKWQSKMFVLIIIYNVLGRE